MQKVILARVLSAGPRVINANQPTRGLDVGAAAKMQEFLYAARAAGAGIVLLSEDPEELLQVCDRIEVLYRGSPAPPAPAAEAEQRKRVRAGKGGEQRVTNE